MFSLNSTNIKQHAHDYKITDFENTLTKFKNFVTKPFFFEFLGILTKSSHFINSSVHGGREINASYYQSNYFGSIIYCANMLCF